MMKYLPCSESSYRGGGRKGNFQEKYPLTAVVPGTVRNRNSKGGIPFRQIKKNFLVEAQRQACVVPMRVEEQHFGKRAEFEKARRKD